VPEFRETPAVKNTPKTRPDNGEESKLNEVKACAILNKGLEDFFKDQLNQVVSRTTISPSDVTHLCQEIRDIKRGSTHQNSIGQINKLKTLSKHLNNTPDPDQDKCDKDGLDYVETVCNKLHCDPPTDSRPNPSHYEPPQTPGHPASSETLSALPPPRVPSGTSARTSSLASSNAAEDPEESPVAGKASDSPSSPSETKLSSRW